MDTTDLKAEDITQDIQKKYAGKWIAIHKGEVLAAGDSVTEVMVVVEKLGLKELPEVVKVLRPDEEMCVL